MNGPKCVIYLGRNQRRLGERLTSLLLTERHFKGDVVSIAPVAVPPVPSAMPRAACPGSTKALPHARLGLEIT